MESNRKRRVSGFVKGKLMPLYRVAKPSSTMQYTSKVKPSQSASATASVGFMVHQDYMVAQPKQKVSFIGPDNNNINNREQLSQFEKIFGVAGDESVDVKADSYIFSVQERFKLERVNSERMK